MLNLIDLYSSGLFLGAMINTCKAVFPHVYVFSTAGETDRRDTFVVVSAKRPLDLEGIAEEVNAAHLTTGEQLGEAELAELAGRVGDVVLTDNFAPVDNLLAPVVAFSQEVFTTRRLGRADRFLKANKPGKALEEVRTALEGDSQNPESWDMLGTIYWEQGNSAEAEAAFERSIEISGNRWPPYHNLASTKFEQQDWQGAIDLWQKVVQLAPAHADARVYMGLAYYNLGDAAEALAQLERAADLDPNRESVWINMGAILFGQGEVAQAAEALEKACALNPENGTVQEQRATAYWRLQRYEEAWQAVAAAQAAGHTVNPEFLKTLQRDSGRTQQAL